MDGAAKHGWPICEKGAEYYCRGGESAELPLPRLRCRCRAAALRCANTCVSSACLRCLPAPAAGTCIENAKDCGLEGRGCCVSSLQGRLTLYWCQAGFYCPEAGAADPSCQRCPPPAQAQQQGPFECQRQALDRKVAGTWV